MDTLDIHNRKHKLEQKVNLILKDERLTSKNKKLLLKLRDDLFATSLSIDRALFYLHRLHRIACDLARILTRLQYW